MEKKRGDAFEQYELKVDGNEKGGGLG